MKNKFFRKSLVISVIVLFIGASIIPSLGGISINKQSIIENTTPIINPNPRANTLYVGGSGPENYSTIQAAIYNASGGDTVFVYDDSSPYNENLIVNVSISLVGEDKNTTIINGNNNGDVIYIPIYTVTIRDFTIIGGGAGTQDAVIKLDNVQYCTIKNNKCINKSFGIYLINSSATSILNNVCSSNLLTNIYLTNSHSNTISNNLCENSDYGFYLFSSRYNSINNNICLNTSVGINIKNTSVVNTITGNICAGGIRGISISFGCIDNDVNSNNCSGNDYGIFVDSSDINEIKSNDCSGNVNGIYVYNSSDITVWYNSCSNNSNSGIILFLSKNSIITYNICSNNDDSGIILFSSNDNMIAFNECLDNDVGINFSGISDGNTITVNVCKGGIQGIFISSIYNNLLSANDCTSNEYGIFIESSSNLDITSNDCSGCMIGGIYIYNSDNNSIYYNTCSNNSDSGIIIISSTLNLIDNNDCYNNNIGINISGVSVVNTITSNVCSDGVRGVSISFGCIDNDVNSNDCSGNDYGIFVDSSDGQSISSNDFSGNLIGIYIYGSNDNIIDNNICSNNNEDGIYLLNYCNNNTISGNIINTNNGNGISLDNSSSNNVTGNTISNGNTGIAIYYSVNNLIFVNIITSNNNGLDIDSLSNNNIIYNNYLENINNAYDAGNNLWNITKTPGINIYGGAYLGGNYWNDYTGNDINSDGLGDTNLPYNSNGNIQNGGDWLPLVNIPPYEPSNPDPADGATDIDTNDDLFWTGGDPDPGNTLTYDVYFDTINPPITKVSSNQSGTSFNPGTMNLTTTYYWRIVTWDNRGATSEGLIWSFTTGANLPPEAPLISGRTIGGVGKTYSYAFVASDPDNDDLYYFIFWGDGTFEDWIGPYNADQVVSLNHSWSVSSLYTIMARVKDTHGEYSNWTTLNIWMPKNKAISNSFILHFFEHFPHAFPILRYLLRTLDLY